MTDKSLARKEEGLHLVVDNAQDFPEEVGPEVKNSTVLYNGLRVKTEDAGWLFGCYHRLDDSGYEGNVRIV